MFKKRKSDLIEGNIPEQLLLFFFPILLGYIFQQLYNTIDAVIVGTYVRKEVIPNTQGFESAEIMSAPITVNVGGATIFVLNVDQFKKL